MIKAVYIKYWLRELLCPYDKITVTNFNSHAREGRDPAICAQENQHHKQADLAANLLYYNSPIGEM